MLLFTMVKSQVREVLDWNNLQAKEQLKDLEMIETQWNPGYAAYKKHEPRFFFPFSSALDHQQCRNHCNSAHINDNNKDMKNENCTVKIPKLYSQCCF